MRGRVVAVPARVLALVTAEHRPIGTNGHVGSRGAPAGVNPWKGR
ncbi:MULTISPECIES: hypothetical protein [Actinosynnema]|nr:hypothetical protein [Actinosynnema pretiosum]MCP2097585.1 hypothetical protein [Actinosynnema pretiosum]